MLEEVSDNIFVFIEMHGSSPQRHRHVPQIDRRLIPLLPGFNSSWAGSAEPTVSLRYRQNRVPQHVLHRLLTASFVAVCIFEPLRAAPCRVVQHIEFLGAMMRS